MSRLLAAERRDPMSQERDRSGGDLEDCGLRWDAQLGCVVWEESFGSDPDSEWCRAIVERIARADREFLSSCGIGWTDEKL